MRIGDLYTYMAGLAQEGVPFVLATILGATGSTPRGAGAKMVVLGDGSIVDTIGGGTFEKQVIQDALVALARRVSGIKEYQLRPIGEGEHALGMICGGEARVLLEVHEPDKTLLVIGAGHIGQRLCQMAKLLDFRVVVLDSREEAVTLERFPAADQLICADPEKTAAAFSIDETTHIVIVTHGHMHDTAALRAVVASAAAYIGMIGSQRKVRTVLGELAAEGVEQAFLARVHAPIGLDLGGQTPGEIALSILAEITADTYAKLDRVGRSTTAEEPQVAS